MGEFYTQAIIIVLGAVALLYAMAKRCTDTIENLENSPIQEGYIIQSHIWTTDIKDAVEEVHSFIQRNISESESEDRYIELFSDKEKIRSLRNKLNRLNKSYNAFSNFRNLFPRLIGEYEELKKWLMRTIAICFAFAIWGASGFLIEIKADFPTTYENIFWSFFYLLLVLSTILVCKIAYHNRRCGSIKTTIRIRKSKYGDIIEKMV